jgi:hypothetical protein
VIQVVEEPLDVRINHPPPSLPEGRPNALARLVGTPLGSEPEGTVGEIRFEERLDDQLGGRLHDPVAHSGNAQMTLAALALGNRYPADR